MNPLFPCFSLLLTFFLFECNSPTPTNSEIAMTFPKDSAFIKADLLLNRIKDSLSNSSQSEELLTLYYLNNRIEHQQELALEAEHLLQKSLLLYSNNIPAQIACLSRLAFAKHYQIKDYSYQKNLPLEYQQAIENINKAIALTKEQDSTSLEAELNIQAAHIAIPHFYFGFQAATSVEAEKLAYHYLENAVEAYLNIGNKKMALKTQRAIYKNSFENNLDKIALGIEVEGKNSIAVANDIEQIFHAIHNVKLLPEQQKQLEAFAKLGLAIYAAHPQQELQKRASLIRFFVHYLRIYHPDKPLDALQLLLEAQELDKIKGKNLYYNAYSIAAIYIELGQLDKAINQYQLALSEEKLSHTDTEKGHFGLAMVYCLQGDIEKGKRFYQTHINQSLAMNGISSYIADFIPPHRTLIKEKALELVQAVGNNDAIEIVTGWK